MKCLCPGKNKISQVDVDRLMQGVAGT